MKVIQKACLNFDISINALHEINFFYTGNTQQQTEIIFTEDDSSCDSQKWGNLAQKKLLISVAYTTEIHTNWREMFLSLFHISFLNFVEIFFQDIIKTF